ncbi:hypothetical protein [Salipiger sp.]|uniref:hypothetical protein n=1 Tax=Salipiger sp. TaxID=2078585 RepID=UPI003A9802CF
MSQIDDLQARISRALDRISQGVERLSVTPPPAAAEPEAGPPPEPEVQELAPTPAEEAPDAPPAVAADSEETERLRAELDDEKIANAQLEERVKVLRARLDLAEAGGGGADAALSEQLEAQREAMSAMDGDLQRLRMSNEMLRRTNQELREALEANVGEPHLVNKAMLAELEALRAARAAEATEARAVLTALEPMFREAGVDGEAM